MTKKEFTSAFEPRAQESDNDFTDLLFDVNLPEPVITERVVEVIKPDPNALLPQGDGSYLYKRFTMTPVGMEFPEDVTDEELIEVGGILDDLGSAVAWNTGDWFNKAENRVWGQMYSASDEFVYQTMADYAWVCRKVDFSIRNRKIRSFAHHRLVAPLAKHPDLQVRWLAYAEMHLLVLKDFKREMALLKPFDIPTRTKWLDWAIAENVLLSQVKELTPPAPPAKSTAQDFTSELRVVLAQVERGDREAIAKARTYIWEISQWLDVVEGGGEEQG